MSKKILYIVALAAFLVPMTNTVYNPNIPIIQQDLKTSTQLIALTISAFTGMMALAQLIYGPLSDRYGRKGILIFGLVVYVISNILIYFSSDIYQPIILRAVQALGVSTGIVVGAAVLSDIYKNNLGHVMGTYQFVILIGPVIGPVIGGIIASLFGWRSIFLFLSLAGTAALAMVHFLLRETLEKGHKTHALTPLRLLKDGRLFFVSLLGLVSLGTIYVFITFFPIILDSYGIGVAMIGFAFLPSGIALLAGSKLGGRLTHKTGPEKVIIMGTAISAAATLAFGIFVHFNNLGIYFALAAFALSGLGSGMFWTASRVYVVSRTHLKASANGVFNFMSFLGATIAPFAGSMIYESSGILVLFASFSFFMAAALMLAMRKLNR